MTVIAVGAILALVLWRIADQVQRRRHDATIQQMLTTFAPAAVAVQQDPKQLLVWYPLAQVSRKLYPDAFKSLDDASGGTFPFTKEQLKAAHARCSSEWLAWERAHDASYKLKAATAQQELAAAGASSTLRSRLDAIEQEKLDLYQRRYSEYVRVAKALQALS